MFFGLFYIIFFILFFTIIGIIAVNLIKGVRTWNQNNQSPRLTVEAKVTAKRTDISRRSQPNAGDVTGAHGVHTTSSTRYYATFEVESGDRMEFCIPGAEYGMLAEGDMGKLSFQGTRYLGFARR